MGANLRAVMVRCVVVLAAGLGAWTTPCLSAAQPATGQVWLISTRHLAWCGGATAGAAPAFWRLGDDSQWVASDEAGFLAGDDPAVPTSFFVHGNRNSETDAIQQGMGYHQMLRCQAPDRPLRHVIWSWPADPIDRRHFRRDAQVKVARCDAESLFLAQLLRRINGRVPVSLGGHSFGPRIILGALHLLAGGELAGQTLADPGATPRSAPIRAVLSAAAEDFYSLLPNGRCDRALGQLDRALITVNAADPVLKHYHALYGRGGPQAMGHVGPACGTDTTKIELLNVVCSVGSIHKWACYSADPSLQTRLPWYAFLQPTAG